MARRSSSVEDGGEFDEPGPAFIGYPNVSAAIGAAVSSGKATLRELQEFYSVEDLYDLIEVLSVDGYNRRLAAKVKD
jgi:hypothetical protein